MIEDKLYQASFKGVPFLVDLSQPISTRVGRKQALFEYPVSDRQKVEDLGLKPRQFVLTAIIKGSGDEYIQARDRFLEVLEGDDGPGELIHPTMGTFLDYVARPSTLIEVLTEAGKATIEITFEKSDQDTQPQEGESALSEVNTKTESAIESVTQEITDSFGVDFSQNFAPAKALLEDFSGFVGSAVDRVNQVTGTIDQFKAELDSFTEDIVTLIQTPAQLATEFSSLLVSVDNLFSAPQDALKVYSGLFDFGDDANEVSPTTVIRSERKQNQDVIIGACKGITLVQQYQLSAVVDYLTVSDIEEQQQLLEDQFNSLDESLIPAEILDSINDVRASVNDFLTAQKLSASQVIEVFTNEVPVAVLAFQYYGTNDLFDEIINLNRPKSNDISFISGDVEVVTA